MYYNYYIESKKMISTLTSTNDKVQIQFVCEVVTDKVVRNKKYLEIKRML